MRRPYVVYTEGRHGTHYVDLVPAWLERECVYLDRCQCRLVGPRHIGWHRRGSLYSNVVCHDYQTFEAYCGGWCRQRSFPVGCNKNTINAKIATKLSRVAIRALADTSPSVPQRGEPLVSVLRSRELKPKWERERLRKHKRWLIRFRERMGRYDGKCSGRYSESDGEESSEEESIA